MKIKTGDMVKIVKGRDAGKTGKVLQVFPRLGKLVVDGAIKSTKHLKKRGNTAGQKLEFSAPLQTANVVLVGKSGTAGRVGYKFLKKEDGMTKVRVLHSKKGVEDVD